MICEYCKKEITKKNKGEYNDLCKTCEEKVPYFCALCGKTTPKYIFICEECEEQQNNEDPNIHSEKWLFTEFDQVEFEFYELKQHLELLKQSFTTIDEAIKKLEKRLKNE